MVSLALSLLALSSLRLASSASLPKRAEGFPVSSSDRDAVLCSIKTYGDASLWPDSQLDIVQDTLELEIADYVAQTATP
jgi:polygalacturonase